ncbi:hypothetical protein [Nocardia sp. NPDC051832]|uniref:hypothetical protein n=1 Tax=Nocardia sp. NPDC051832 TaxID=3155673 RepID=UPI00344638FD
MALLQADIDQLKALSTTLDDISNQVDALDVRSAAKAIVAALPGTPLGEACDLATEYTEGAWLRVSQRIGKVSSTITHSTNEFAATDETFKKSLEALGFHA